MLQTGESENEILLGNKQLLAIFFVVVLLLGVAFAGGYKLGLAKRSGATTAADTATAGQTHEVPAGGSTDTASSAPSATSTDTSSGATTPPAPDATAQTSGQQAPLGSRKHTKAPAAPAEDTEAAGPPPTRGEFTPQTGQVFLQVAAVGRDEAEAVADVLHKKGFRAHAVPKPGNTKVYRVLIGPLKDAADLSATRDSLRRTGFREVITQRY
jgi:cell division septation protein DedD